MLIRKYLSLVKTTALVANIINGLTVVSPESNHTNIFTAYI